MLTALVAGTVAIAAIVFSCWGMWLFCVIVSLLALWEFWGLEQVGVRMRYGGLSLAALGWILLAFQAMGKLPYEVMWAWPLLFLPAATLIALFDPQSARGIASLFRLLFGMAYIWLPMILFWMMSFYPARPAMGYDMRVPLGVLALIWVLDIGAYFFGKYLGKRPLFPRISPKKTWMGSIGGALVCILLGIYFQYWSEMQLRSPHSWLVTALIIAVAGQLGDLVESMFKRHAKVKDSGSLLPGHGGILDRFDGLFFSLPLLFLYFALAV